MINTDPFLKRLAKAEASAWGGGGGGGGGLEDAPP